MNCFFFRCAHFFFLFIVLFFLSCQSQTKIINSISEKDANEILVLLASKDIPAQKTPTPVAAVGGGTGDQKWDISVPSSRITEAISILNQSGVPRPKGTTLLDLFGAQGLVPSDMQDKIRYQEGLSEQLATTIRKIEGIVDADVQITLPSEDEENKTLTASVFIKHKGILDNPNSLLVMKIKRLVSSALPGLSLDNVSVVADRAILSEIQLYSPTQAESQKDYITIWGVTVAKESASFFRMIFYAFLILLFLLACLLAWLIWKLFPVIEKIGWKNIFKAQPLDVTLLTTTPQTPMSTEESEIL